MKLHEPVTFATDLLLGAWAFGLFFRLPPAALLPERLWRWSFPVIGIAALSGGLFHGFETIWPVPATDALWALSQVAGGGWALLLVTSEVVRFPKPLVRRLTLATFAIKFISMISIAVMTGAFIWIVIECTSSLLFLAAFSLWRIARERKSRYRQVVTGVAVGLCGGWSQSAGVGLPRIFNHNDVFHVIMMIALYLLYLGTSDGRQADTGIQGASA